MNELPRKVLARLDLETVFKASRCVLAAERLLVFRKLHENNFPRLISAGTPGLSVNTVNRFLICLSVWGC